MPSSEDLVPTGLPHGERQRLERFRGQAGLPMSSEQAARSQAVRRLGATPGAAVRQPARPTFDALLDTDPARVGPAFAGRNEVLAEASRPRSLEQRLSETAEASNNDFYRGVTQRMRVLRGAR